MAPYFYYVKDSVQHVVWFQDARSVDALARLAEEYSLDGINVWNIMRRFPNLWQVLLSLFPIKKVI
jgi:spore germination protein